MKHWLVLLFLVLSASAYSQVVDSIGTLDSTPTKEEIVIPETMPVYPNGQAGLMHFLLSVAYPKEAKQNKISGTVYVQFVIDNKGFVTNIEVARSSGHKILDDTALQHVGKMEQWTPATKSGQPVNVKYVVPVKFKL